MGPNGAHRVEIYVCGTCNSCRGDLLSLFTPNLVCARDAQACTAFLPARDDRLPSAAAQRRQTG
eukprot:5305395-Prymnesium_polylepis.2